MSIPQLVDTIMINPMVGQKAIAGTVAMKRLVWSILCIQN
jgi:hypothetical protein